MASDNQINNGLDKQLPETPEPVVVRPDSDFITPDQAAATDQTATATPLIDAKEEPAEDLIEENMKQKKKRFNWPPTKKQLIIAGVVAAVVLIAVGVLLYTQLNKPKTVVSVTKAVIVPPKPKTVASNLSGLQVAPSLNAIPVTAVMVENTTDARPQSGLSDTGVVFEAVAEGGVTRFMALYQDTSPANVGPIRSARPYYVAWALGFDAGYAHVGGSVDALADIKAWGVRDLDEFANGAYYHRITTRQAPHNVYTGIGTLNQLETKKGYTSSSFTIWPRKAAAPAKLPSVTQISMSLSGPVYNPSYVYSASTNSYNRSEYGAPQIDANTNTQISPKVVIGIVVPKVSGALDSSGAYYSDYNFVGSGQAYIFQDGTLTIGQWTKSSNSAQILFTDSNSKPLALDPGQTWITAVSTPAGISYAK
ncbi:MAG TPA: DUF3048 domain-containing protein [Candidatus Saccharimonadales bacterium]